MEPETYSQIPTQQPTYSTPAPEEEINHHKVLIGLLIAYIIGTTIAFAVLFYKIDTIAKKIPSSEFVQIPDPMNPTPSPTSNPYPTTPLYPSISPQNITPTGIMDPFKGYNNQNVPGMGGISPSVGNEGSNNYSPGN